MLCELEKLKKVTTQYIGVLFMQGFHSDVIMMYSDSKMMSFDVTFIFTIKLMCV